MSIEPPMTGQGVILAVDDTPASLRLLTDILKAEGYTVRSAINGELALRSAFASPPELVLLDVNMPNMDGFEVCRQLRANPATREVPVIFVSALSETVEKVRGFEFGAVDYVTKPYQREELLARVRTHVELSRLRNHLEVIVEARTAALRESERQLRAATEKLQIVSDNAVEWSFWRNPDGSFNYVSPACKTISGYTPGEIYADPDLPEKMLHPGDQEQWRSHRRQADQGGCPAPLEYRIINRQGQVRWISHLCRPLYGSEGEFIGTRGCNTDITALKQAQEAIEQINQTLEARVEDEVAKNRQKDHMLILQSRSAAMGEILHHIAHQWRQPLTAIAALLANILDEQRFHELTEESLERDIARGNQILQSLSTTIDDFRNFFLPNDDPEVFNVDRVIQEAVAVIGPSFEQFGIRIASTPSEQLAEVHSHRNEFTQVVLNILQNAKDAILEHAVAEGKITICIQCDDKEATVSIQDNGGPIPDDVLSRIFDPYFSTKPQGTGIGLYMSKMIMDHLGGRIEAQNLPDGMEFSVTIPLGIHP